MGVLGGLCPPNTPYLPHRHGDSQRTEIFQEKRKYFGGDLQFAYSPR